MEFWEWELVLEEWEGRLKEQAEKEGKENNSYKDQMGDMTGKFKMPKTSSPKIPSFKMPKF